MSVILHGKFIPNLTPEYQQVRADPVRAVRPIFGLKRMVRLPSIMSHINSSHMDTIDTESSSSSSSSSNAWDMYQKNIRIKISFESGLWNIPALPFMVRTPKNKLALVSSTNEHWEYQQLDLVVLSFVHSKRSGSILSVTTKSLHYKPVPLKGSTSTSTTTTTTTSNNNNINKLSDGSILFEYQWIEEIEPNVHIGYAVMYGIVLVATIYVLVISCRCLEPNYDSSTSSITKTTTTSTRYDEHQQAEPISLSSYVSDSSYGYYPQQQQHYSSYSYSPSVPKWD